MIFIIKYDNQPQAAPTNFYGYVYCNTQIIQLINLPKLLAGVWTSDPIEGADNQKTRSQLIYLQFSYNLTRPDTKVNNNRIRNPQCVPTFLTRNLSHTHPPTHSPTIYSNSRFSSMKLTVIRSGEREIERCWLLTADCWPPQYELVPNTTQIRHSRQGVLIDGHWSLCKVLRWQLLEIANTNVNFVIFSAPPTTSTSNLMSPDSNTKET